MVKVITIMDDVYSDLYRLKREKGLSFSGVLRHLMDEKEKKKDILSFAGSISDLDVDKHTIENARKSSRAWKRLI